MEQPTEKEITNTSSPHCPPPPIVSMEQQLTETESTDDVEEDNHDFEDEKPCVLCVRTDRCCIFCAKCVDCCMSRLV
jgi:hypothetical protein